MVDIDKTYIIMNIKFKTFWWKGDYLPSPSIVSFNPPFTLPIVGEIFVTFCAKIKERNTYLFFI